jgi:hypothetical protein
MVNYRVLYKIRIFLQNQGANEDLTARRPERSALGVHIADMSRIKFLFATQGLSEKRFFQVAYIDYLVYMVVKPGEIDGKLSGTITNKDQKRGRLK